LKPELAALAAGALLVLLAFLLLSDSGGSHRAKLRANRQEPQATSSRPASQARPDIPSEHSGIGAVHSATRYLSELSEAAVANDHVARQIVNAITTGSLRATLERSLPATATAIEERLRGSRSATVFDGWPLGFRVESFDSSRAMVAIWHLDVGASSALGLMTTQYTTTTYELRWIERSWRIAAAESVAGPTPPPASAPAAEVDEFARETRPLARYTYGP
jgi:hypothetical protein